MLEKILIKNYLLLKDIEINFSGGFNIITGETGTGKSILINALGLLFGERADYQIISRNKEKMIIEGVIKKTNNNKKAIDEFIKNNSLEDSNAGYLIIRRELYTKGYSRSFVNDSPANVNDLKTLGDEIVDIHSQNEHQSLLKKEIHIELLDRYLEKLSGGKTGFKDKLVKYKEGFVKLVQLDKDLNEFYSKKDDLENKRTFLEFQLKEISEVNPKPNEDDELEKELKSIENAEVIQQNLSSAYKSLYEESGSVVERIKYIEKELDKIKEFNKDIPALLNDVSASSNVLNEISRQVNNILSNLSYDPVRIEEIRERLYKLQFIKKKYGGSLDEAIKLKENLEKDLSLLDNFDETISKLEKEINLLKENLFKEAEILSKSRKEASKTLESEVKKILNEVGFENAEFKTEASPQAPLQRRGDEETDRFNVKTKGGFVRLTERGIDDVEFLVKINKGDDFSSLRKTASGGEVSRIMLALKTVLADADKTDVLIFDEIDTGISGRIAQKVGRVLKKLSEYRQVISITHLAQIAALAEEHFLVEKESGSDKTETRIKKLNKDEKVIEVAKLLSGEKVTDSSIKSAKELISS
jgi:DNA repair protein RecN (Recombination protein N)